MQQKLIKVRVWDPAKVANKVVDIVLHCVDCLHRRGGDWPTADQIVQFGEQVALCVNLYNPLDGEARRPRLELDGATFIFENGITAETNLDNYPRLCVSGLHFKEVAPLEDADLVLKFGHDLVQLIFQGDNFLYSAGAWGRVTTAIPKPLSAEV